MSARILSMDRGVEVLRPAIDRYERHLRVSFQIMRGRIPRTAPSPPLPVRSDLAGFGDGNILELDAFRRFA